MVRGRDRVKLGDAFWLTSGSGVVPRRSVDVWKIPTT